MSSNDQKKPKRKKGRGGSKGNPFERAFCTRLSEWVTYGVHDDVFWRSQTSGARATVRGRTGQRTHGQAGDIAATHPDYSHLTTRVVWELKRGYAEANLHRLLETRHLEAINPLEGFISKTVNTAAVVGAPFWVLVTRRDFASTLIWYPRELHVAIRRASDGAPWECMGAVVMVKLPLKTGGVVDFIGMTENDFFETDPRAFEAAVLTEPPGI